MSWEKYTVNFKEVMKELINQKDYEEYAGIRGMDNMCVELKTRND